MRNNMPSDLQDFERALLFLYVLDAGLPKGGRFCGATVAETQVKILAAFTGWDEARAIAAMNACLSQGYANQTSAP